MLKTRPGVGCLLHAVHLGGKPPFKNNGSIQTATTHFEQDLKQGSWKGGRRWQEAGEEVRGESLLGKNRVARFADFPHRPMESRSVAQTHHTASPTTSIASHAPVSFVLFFLGHLHPQLFGPVEFR